MAIGELARDARPGGRETELSERSRIVVSAETAYPRTAAGARVRLASTVAHLAPHGIDLRYRPTLTEDEYATISARRTSFVPKGIALARGAARAIQRRDEHDLVLVHRLRFLTPLPGVEPLPSVDVYDFDDALFVGGTLPWHRRFAWIKQEAARCRSYLSRARLVIAGNSYLAAEARRWGARVEVVPSCVDPSIQGPRKHEQRDPIHVGWIGSVTTSPYLKEVLPVFERLNAGGLRAKLVLVGAGANLQAPWIEHRTWSLEREHAELADFDIGVMPMPDTTWTRGKCGYKVLQYFACGVPAVASPVGVARGMVSDERGRLAGTQDEWLKALDELIRDAGLRQELGGAGRVFVEQEYSYQRWAPRLAELLRQL